MAARKPQPKLVPDLDAMHACIEGLRAEADRLLFTHPHHAHRLYVGLHEAALAVGAMRAES